MYTAVWDELWKELFLQRGWTGEISFISKTFEDVYGTFNFFNVPKDQGEFIFFIIEALQFHKQLNAWKGFRYFSLPAFSQQDSPTFLVLLWVSTLLLSSPCGIMTFGAFLLPVVMHPAEHYTETVHS